MEEAQDNKEAYSENQIFCAGFHTTKLEEDSYTRSASIESGPNSVHDDQASETGSSKRRKVDYFPATRLFEYQWPLGNEGAEFYILQEQVKEFLDIRGIQRKYPDICRRNVELDERKYLMGRGVVTETQSNMGLVALRSEEVLELMAEDYPEKYQEYQSVLQEREFQATLRKKMMESRRVALLAESQLRVGASQVTSEAIRSVVNFNSQLARSRQLARNEYADSQTKLTHVPRRPPMVCVPPPMSRYPVALLPGQYCDHVTHYSPTQLNRLPLKTVMNVPKGKKAAVPEVTSVQEDSASGSLLNSLFSLPMSSGMTPSSALPRAVAPKANISLSSSILSAILAKLPSVPKPATTTTAATTEMRRASISTTGTGMEPRRASIGTTETGMEPKQASSSTTGTGMEPRQASIETGMEPRQHESHSHAAPAKMVSSPSLAISETGTELKRAELPKKDPILIPKPAISEIGTEVKVIAQSGTVPVDKESIPIPTDPEIDSGVRQEEDSSTELKMDEGKSIKDEDSASVKEVKEVQRSDVEDSQSGDLETATVDAIAMETDGELDSGEGNLAEGKIKAPSTGASSANPTASTPGADVPRPLILGGEVSSVPVEIPRRKVGKMKVCSVCFKGSSCNKFGVPEDMLTCSYCKARVHPSCYDLSKKAVSILRGYPWQCLECKSCQLCSNTDKDDQMMCCDECDRGYHSFCVGLQEIPAGQWLCRLCNKCASCGRGFPTAITHGGDTETKWIHEYHKGQFLQTLCLECSSYFNRGYFCPACLRVYHDDETDSPMVCCDHCDRWIHTECDGISDERYRELSQDNSAVYVCCLCRGERQERVDKYHKKHKKD